MAFATLRPFVSLIPAASYSPAGSPPKYHRRWRTLLLCSGWEEVCPLRYGHRKGYAGAKVPAKPAVPEAGADLKAT